MKRGFVTNELLIVFALFVLLFAISLPISNRFGWGTLGALPISMIGFVLVFCVLNAREIFDQFRGSAKSDHENNDGGDSRNGLA